MRHGTPPIVTSVRRRPAPRSARRAELLDIALELFAERGIERTTVRDIGDAAGILSGSLYHHFRSKTEIVAEILSGGLDQVAHHSRIGARSPVPAPARLAYIILEYVRWVAANPRMASMLDQNKDYLREEIELADIEEARQSNRLVWVSVVERGQSDGTFRTDIDSDVAVRAMFDGLSRAVRWFPPNGEFDAETIARQLAGLYVRGLVAPGVAFEVDDADAVAALDDQANEAH